MSASLVGVLGGVGPGATAYFLQRLVERTTASCDQEHIRTLAFNDTAVPDRTAFLTGVSSRNPLDTLLEDGLLLEACGCDLLALPCNTAHCFLDELQGRLHVPLVNMVRETVVAAARAGLRRIEVLATAGTRACDVYGREAARLGLECIYPTPLLQERVSRLIFEEVKAGLAVDSRNLDELAAAAAQEGADGIVLGCTELSYGFGGRTHAGGLPVIDALDVLVDCVIERTGHHVRQEFQLAEARR